MSMFTPTIGLEIHAELKTRTKMFCDSLNVPTETHPNKNICPICMGHPGTLPVPNRDAIRKIIAVGLAVNGTIAERTHFDRKNYFYPDLPKGYQISQYDHPLVIGGWLEIPLLSGDAKRIRIRRVHLEEDTGRSVHDEKSKTTLLDFNRAGVPLMELVTEPDLAGGEEVRTFAETLREILQYVDASDAGMEKGGMRIEANVSLAEAGSPLGTKVELKNINSFRFVERAIASEVERQRSILERGGEIVQETRGWDAARGTTIAQRLKEESHDYRYFPEPDIPPLRIDEELIEEVRAALPELPREKLARLTREYGLEPRLVRILVTDRHLAGFFEATASELELWIRDEGKDPADHAPLRVAANYLTTDVIKIASETGRPLPESPMTPENFAELITYLVVGKISSRAAKDVLHDMYTHGTDPSPLLTERKLWQVSDTDALGAAIEKVITEQEKAALDFRAGKETALQFLVGQVMKESRDANPEVVRKLLQEKLQ